MKRERQQSPDGEHERHQSRLLDAARRGTRSAGEPIRDSVRAPLEARFGHDFRNVRIHDDAQANRAASDLASHAYTMGEDVVFGEGQYAPETAEGARKLTHELTHVVQQSHHATSVDATSVNMVRPDDGSERAAERATETAAAGKSVTSTDIGSVGDPAGASSGAAVVQRWSLSGAWDDVTDAASSVGSGLESAGSAVYSGYEKATDFSGMANAMDSGVDWLEAKSKGASQAMVDAASGIPVVDQVAQGAAWFNNATTDLTGGLVKGAGDLTSGALNGMAHPIDAMSGMQSNAEHFGTGIPFYGTMMKAEHGIYDLAVNGGGEYGDSFSGLANHVFNPLQQARDDAKYASAVDKGMVAPGDEKDGAGWQRWFDNPLEATSRALTNILPVALGVSEAAAPEVAGRGMGPKSTPPGTGAPQTILDLINESLRNADSASDGSRPLTTAGDGRDAPVVEANESTPRPQPSAGGGGGGTAVAEPSGPGWLSRVRGWMKERVGGGSESPAPPPAPQPVSPTPPVTGPQADADAYLKRMQAAGKAAPDAELNQTTTVKQTDGGYGSRPLGGGDPNSLASRRRRW